jgi:hypothetical protein
MSYPATDKQISFITKLALERGYSLNEDATAITSTTAAVLDLTTLDKRQASGLIDLLLSTPKAKAAPAPAKDATAGTAEELTDGMYQLPTGEIFKAQYAANGSGRLYAKALEVTEDGNEDPEIRFVYAPGAIRRLTLADKMTKEAAKEFGQLYGVCCVCARILTDETSIAEGIGPICGNRF